jgi:hypothetical protein
LASFGPVTQNCACSCMGGSNSHILGRGRYHTVCSVTQRAWAKSSEDCHIACRWGFGPRAAGGTRWIGGNGRYVLLNADLFRSDSIHIRGGYLGSLIQLRELPIFNWAWKVFDKPLAISLYPSTISSGSNGTHVEISLGQNHPPPSHLRDFPYPSTPQHLPTNGPSCPSTNTRNIDLRFDLHSDLGP